MRLFIPHAHYAALNKLFTNPLSELILVYLELKGLLAVDEDSGYVVFIPSVKVVIASNIDLFETEGNIFVDTDYGGAGIGTGNAVRVFRPRSVRTDGAVRTLINLN